MDLVFVGSIAVILLVMAADAALRGPWLDEFWTLELSDPGRGLSALVSDGWLRDTHPPAFNLWATLLSSLGINAIPWARLASNLPAAGLMIWAAVSFSRRIPGTRSYHLAMSLLVLALPLSVEAFANYRSYFWQIASLASLAAVTRHVVATPVDLDFRRDLGLAAISILAVFGSMALHYVGAIFGGLLAAAVFFTALARGHWRWAMLVSVTGVAAFVQVVAVAFLQARNWAVDLDHSWIEASSIALAVAVPVALVVAALANNLVPLAALWPGSRRWTASERTFVALLAGVLGLGTIVVLVIDAFRPIMVDRYLFAVPVLVCAIMAAMAAKLDRARPLRLLLPLWAVAMVSGQFFLHGAKPQWEEGARSVAKIVETCSTTRIYAASGWALGPAAETRAARREDAVFRRAYEDLASEHGYEVRFLGQNEKARVTLGRCPVLVWYEHTPNNAEDDPRVAVEAAGLTGIEEARLSVLRSPTGFVVRADR